MNIMDTIRYYRTIDIFNQSNIASMSDAHIINAVGIDTMPPVHTNIYSGRKDYYMLYMVEGSLLFKLNNGDSKTLSPGMGIFIHCNKPYDYRSKTDIISYYWVHLTGYSALETLERFDFSHEFIFDIGHNEKIVSLFHKMFKEFTLKKPDFIYMSSLYLLETFVEIKRSLLNKKSNKSHLEKSLNYINKNCFKDITLQELADLENMPISTYRSVFTKLMEVSPKQYIISLRISYAANLLQFTDRPIHEIAEQCGYTDLGYFYRIFKKITKLTPLECREAAANSNIQN